MSHSSHHSTPSPFVVEWVSRLARRSMGSERALDVAMGSGRHALVLARAGFATFGVDARLDAVGEAVALAAREGFRVRGWCADLTAARLPMSAFELVVVTRYLDRQLFPSLRDTVRPGGVIVYETFTVGQLAHGVGPTSPDHLLRAGELREGFDDWEVLFYEETSTPEALARIVARRPNFRSS